MKVALEYDLAKRMRSATRWAEGQQGLLSDDSTDATDGFGRTMLVRTGALPANYTGTVGVPGTIIDRQPNGTNTAGVAVLVKDINGGTLAANTNYSARLGGYDTGKAVYFVAGGASGAVGGDIGTGGTIGNYGQGLLIKGDDGITYNAGTFGSWWETINVRCTFRKTGKNTATVVGTGSAILTGQALFHAYSDGFDLSYYRVFTSYYTPSENIIAKDPIKLAAHMTNDRIARSRATVEPSQLFNAISYFNYSNQLYGTIISVTAGMWPWRGLDPLHLNNYSPFWNGVNSYTPPILTPLGGPL